MISPSSKIGKIATATSWSSAARSSRSYEAAHNDANKVRGCVSQVWLECETPTNAAGHKVLHFRGDSDSHLVRGLIAIAFAIYNDREPQYILAEDARADFTELGLAAHLTRSAPMACAR